MPSDYTDRVLEGFPRGKAWPRQVGGWLWKLARALGIEFGRVDTRGDELLAEMDPRTATETLPDWERVTGLPDPADENPPTTLADRRAAVTSVWTTRGQGVGGPGPASLRALIVGLGYAEEDVRIRRFHMQPLRAGIGAAGDPVNESGDALVTEVIARSGSLDSTVRQRVAQYALAARPVTFAFPLLQWSDAILIRNTATFTEPVTGSEIAIPAGQYATAFFDGGNLDVEFGEIPS